MNRDAVCRHESSSAASGGDIRGLDQNYAEQKDDADKVGNWRIDERNGQKYQVFFVVAPDGLCYYFHEPLSEQGTQP